MKKFLYSIPAVLLPSLAFAEGEQSVTIPEAFTNFDFQTLISTMATTVAPILLSILGLAAGVYIVRWCWKMLKGTAK